MKNGEVEQFTEAGMVTFENVSFGYEGSDEKILSGLNFEIRKYRLFAIIGVTGSGKSTLLKLILRFFDVAEGKVKVNGR